MPCATPDWVGSARVASRPIGLLTHQDDHATRTNGVGLWTGQDRLLTPDGNISGWGEEGIDQSIPLLANGRRGRRIMAIPSDTIAKARMNPR